MWWLVLLALLSGSAWDTWRAQVTLSNIKLLFALSAFPFTVLLIGPIRKLVSHVDATGYTKRGRIVAADPNGLSSYLAWLAGDILDAGNFRTELEEDFLPADLERLREAVAKGEQTLEKAWKQPISARKVTAKAKASIDALLASIVTRESASDALYTACFPERVSVEKFAAARQREARLFEMAKAEQAERAAAEANPL